MSTNKKLFTLKHGDHVVGIYGNIKAAYEVAFCLTDNSDRKYLVRYQQAVDGLKNDISVSLCNASLEGYTIECRLMDTKCNLDFVKAMQEFKALEEEEKRQSRLASQRKLAASYKGTIIDSL